MDMKLEVVVIPVSDVDRAKSFYADTLGFVVDVDQSFGDEFRVVQMTPPGSACSVTIGKGLNDAAPGSVKGMQLVVATSPPAARSSPGAASTSPRSATTTRARGSTARAARGTRSSSSTTRMATAGRSRRSPPTPRRGPRTASTIAEIANDPDHDAGDHVDDPERARRHAACAAGRRPSSGSPTRCAEPEQDAERDQRRTRARSPPVTPEPGEERGERQDRHRVGQRQAQGREVGAGQARRVARSTVAAGPGTGPERPPGEPQQEERRRPGRASGRPPTSTSVIADRPNAAMRAVGRVGRGDAQPGYQPDSRPSASVRRMTSRLIGPTAAAIVNPRIKPRSEERGIHGLASIKRKRPRHAS